MLGVFYELYSKNPRGVSLNPINFLANYANAQVNIKSCEIASDSQPPQVLEYELTKNHIMYH